MLNRLGLRLLTGTISAALVLFTLSCTKGPAGKTGDSAGLRRIRIGLSLDTLKEERWQRDRDLFVQYARDLGADVVVQAANGDDRVQMQQAENLLTQALTQANNDVVAIVASNDATAGGSIQALESQKLTGKVLVSGQDADLGGLQRIVAGTQSMTVYKPVAQLAPSCCRGSGGSCTHEKVEATSKVNNGKINVPSILLEPVVVNKDNIVEMVVKDGYQKMEDIYRNVPREQWPQPQAKAKE